MAQITIAGGGAFTKKNIDDLNSNITELYAGSSGGTFASPTITGTVAGGASYTAPTLTSPTITGTTSIGAGATLTSPTFVTPALGTPASGVATNLTGTAAGLTAGVASAVAVGGITGLGTGVGTFLATPSSANLAAAVTGETGTGALVFADTPTLVTPVLGAATGTSVVLSGNCRAASFNAGATAGVTAGPFTTVASINVIGGIVTTLTGS